GSGLERGGHQVKNHQLVSGLEQVHGHGPTHVTQTDKGNTAHFVVSLISVVRFSDQPVTACRPRSASGCARSAGQGATKNRWTHSSLAASSDAGCHLGC